MRMNESNSISIVVDGDACPVKKEIAETARTFRVPVLLVSSYDHLQQAEEGVTTVQVDRSDQSADLYIANHISRGYRGNAGLWTGCTCACQIMPCDFLSWSYFP